MDTARRFLDTFIPGRDIKVMRIIRYDEETMLRSESIAEMDWSGVLRIDPAVAKIAVHAKARDMNWIGGGVEFLVNHEYGHWERGKPGMLSGTRNLAGEGEANLYALVKSGNPVEDYSSLFALTMATTYYGAMNYGWTNPFHEVRAARMDIRKAFVDQVRSEMKRHRVGLYLKERAIEDILARGLEKFLTLVPLISKEQPDKQ